MPRCVPAAVCSETVATVITPTRPVKEVADRNEAKINNEAQDWEVTGI